MTDQLATMHSAFEVLDEDVQAALAEQGFESPTEPQDLAIPPIAKGDHTLVIAPTGTGKTETAMLPIFNSIVQNGTSFGISALYITPLRALNRDMQDRLDWWGEQLDIEIDVRHGDTSDYQRRQQATDPPDVLVTTPETLQAMFTGERLKEALADIEHIVIDEVHELAASKRGAQLVVGLERLREHAGPFQRVGLSATVGDPEAVGTFLTGGRDVTIKRVDVGSRLEVDVVVPEVTTEDESLAGELMIDAELASHVRTIRDIVAENESSLIFVNTRQTAEALGSRFTQLTTVDIGIHHGSLSRDARVEVEDKFKQGELDALLCTSSMELGIDVGHVDHVVQYSSPRQVARLLQRIGRAGHRFEEISSGTIVATNNDDAFEALSIARRAKEGLVEPAEIHVGSLDVVANQVAAIVNSRDEIDANKVYEIINNAAPFQDLTEETFREVVEELAGNRILQIRETQNQLVATGTWQYVYNNLSMIPDEETYDVKDVASGNQVGTLDERFVTTILEPGESFIQGGDVWRVVTIDDGDSAVKVSPIEDPVGEVPSWIGQEIPVPYPIATEVGELRRVTTAQFEHGATKSDVARDVVQRYPAKQEIVERSLGQIERHSEVAPPPTDSRILIEQHGRTVVLNASFGHQTNETLGRILSSLLGQQTGSSVGLQTGPYRIELEVPPNTGAKTVKNLLYDTDPEHVQPLIELTLDRSDTLMFRLAQVAEHFGTIKSWRGDTGMGQGRLQKILKDTPAYEEAKRAVIHDDLDLEQTAAILRRIQHNDIDIELVGERTPIGTGGRNNGGEFLAPENADASVITTVRDRILSDDITLLCVHCKDWERTKPVKRVRDQPTCSECGSTMIAALNAWDEETIGAVRAKDKDDDQDHRTRRAYQAASLVQAHGKKAVTALAARGVGPDTAARIINKHREEEIDFYRDILEAERQYARTQSFWD